MTAQRFSMFFAEVLQHFMSNSVSCNTNMWHFGGTVDFYFLKSSFADITFYI